MTDANRRETICKSLGFENLLAAHQVIVMGASKEPSYLLHKGLNAKTLTELGYDATGMTRLGFAPAALESLGYAVAHKPHVAEEVVSERTSHPDPAALIAKGYRASDLSQAGVTIHHCRTAGVAPRELRRIGYSLEELASQFSPAELRSIGFNAREMSRVISGPQLRSVGFTASEMRMSGYSIRDLLQFGYSENHIKTAGYSVSELAREGLSRMVEDKKRLRH